MPKEQKQRQQEEKFLRHLGQGNSQIADLVDHPRYGVVVRKTPIIKRDSDYGRKRATERAYDEIDFWNKLRAVSKGRGDFAHILGSEGPIAYYELAHKTRRPKNWDPQQNVSLSEESAAILEALRRKHPQYGKPGDITQKNVVGGKIVDVEHGAPRGGFALNSKEPADVLRKRSRAYFLGDGEGRMNKTAFWAGFEKQADEQQSRSKLPLVLGGIGLLAGGTFLGAKGLMAAQRRIRNYGGRTGNISKHIFGHNDVKPSSFKSYYQGDTKYPGGGVFDHIAVKDLAPDAPRGVHVDPPGIQDLVNRIGHIRKKGKYSPLHDAHLLKNQDGTWEMAMTTYHRPVDSAIDRRHGFLSSHAVFDKKPSPEVADGLRQAAREHYPKAKYVG